MRKIKSKNSKEKKKKNFGQKTPFSEDEKDFPKSTTPAMEDEALEFEESENEQEMARESAIDDLEDEDVGEPAPALQNLYNFLNLKLSDVNDEETMHKCHALIAFHKLIVSRCDELQEQSAKLATASKGIHVENNPLWIYLSSSL